MSDGSISQAEIDALLSGVEMGAGDSPAAGASFSGGGLSSAQSELLQSFCQANVGSFCPSLESLTGKTVSISPPRVEISSKEEFSRVIPDMLVATVIDFEGEFAGDHLFLMAPEFAQKLVNLVSHEDNDQIDDMGLSVVSETITQYVSAQLSTLEVRNVQNVSVAPAESVQVPKAMVRFPPQRLCVFTYTVELDGTSYTLWELVSEQLMVRIIERMGGAMQRPQAQVGNSQMGGVNMQMGIGAASPSVQSVQFHPLQNAAGGAEQGNIGLIMDVFMEVTVELGRTRMMIKDILGMGEGHIIELDKLAGEPVDILVNHKLIAKGEVVVIDENFGVRVTEILSPGERIADV